jgi:hypothetical protein
MNRRRSIARQSLSEVDCGGKRPPVGRYGMAVRELDRDVVGGDFDGRIPKSDAHDRHDDLDRGVEMLGYAVLDVSVKEAALVLRADESRGGRVTSSARPYGR